MAENQNQNKPAKSWCFTLNNPTESEMLFFEKVNTNQKYIGKEHWEEGEGTPHLQGLIVFKTAYRLTQLKKLSPRASWSITRAQDHAENYCMKENLWIKEDNRQQGMRTDLQEFKGAVLTGKRPRELVDEHLDIMVRLPNAWHTIMRLCSPERTEAPQVFWFWGPTGSGKSHTARVMTNPESREERTFHNGFASDYTYADDFIIQEFRPADMNIKDLLQMTDRYSYDVNIKHGTARFVAKRVFICSPMSPQRMYKESGEDLLQIIRRCTRIWKFEKLKKYCNRL